MFGRSTRFEIPFKDIYRAVKTGNAFLLNRSIKVFLVEDEPVVFTNFMFRDDCYNLISRLLKAHKI